MLGGGFGIHKVNPVTEVWRHQNAYDRIAHGLFVVQTTFVAQRTIEGAQIVPFTLGQRATIGARRELLKRFGEKGLGPWGEAGYDSVYILAKAMEKAGSVDDVKKVIKAMNALTTSDIPELVAQYREGKLLDENGQAYPKIIVAQWKAGKLVSVLANWGN